MKYLVFSFLFISGVIQSQTVKVLRNERITQPGDGEFIISSVSSDGEKLLASSPDYKGLFLIDLRSKRIDKITDRAGAGFEPAFSPDNKRIFYRSDEFVELKKYSSLLSFDLVTKKEEVLEKKSRDLSPPKSVGNKLIYSISGRHNVKITGPEIANGKGEAKYIMLENLRPVLYEEGKRRVITPSGEGNYIWVSLSPDKTMLLYNYGGRGTFISDLAGNIIASPGRIDAPVWLNNQIVIGMNDRDDGYRITSSDIISYSLVTGIETNLTSTQGEIELDPVPLQGGNKVFYHNIKGELFVLSLELK